MTYSGLHESINAQHKLGVRPLCSCCGGGEYRGAGYTHTKATSHKLNLKARRGKARYKDHRDGSTKEPAHI